MPPSNSGSFGAAAGGVSPELQAAISRRAGGNPSGPTGQVTQGSPTFNPSIQPPSTPSLPSPQGGISVPPASNPMPSSSGGVGLPIGTSEAELIIKALSSRLGSFSKQEEARLGI